MTRPPVDSRDDALDANEAKCAIDVHLGKMRRECRRRRQRRALDLMDAFAVGGHLGEFVASEDFKLSPTEGLSIR